jgi:cytochrome c oxidase subunit 2
MPSTHRAYDDVAGIYFPIAIGVFAAVVLTLAVLVVRGAKRSQAGRRSEAKMLESAYSLVLACVVGFLLWLTFTHENPIDHLVSHPSLRLRVTAAQWSWRLRYPDGFTVTAVSTWHPAPAFVPVGVEIQIDGTSLDVIHGMWVPGVQYQRQLIPGYVTHFDLMFNRPGLYVGECSVYCGEYHTQMHFAIDAVSDGAFHTWLASGGSHT